MPTPCRCKAYPFPHRQGGGKCPGTKFVCKRGHGFDEPVGDTISGKIGDDRGAWIPDEFDGRCPICGTEDYEEM